MLSHVSERHSSHTAEYCSAARTYHILFFPSLFSGHLSWFHTVGCCDYRCYEILMQVLYGHMFSFLLGWICLTFKFVNYDVHLYVTWQ